MFEHFDTVLAWEIGVYPSAERARSTSTLRKWYAAAPELWFWKEDKGLLIGLLAIVPFTMESVLQLASCEFGELEQDPYPYWRERKNFTQTVFHVYEFYVANHDHSLAFQLFNQARKKLSTICRKVGALPFGVSALCVTEAGRKCAIECGLDIVTKTGEKVKTEIPPELRFSDLGPTSKLQRMIGDSMCTRKPFPHPIMNIDAPLYFAYNVFLSHSAKDQQMANRIYSDIRRDSPKALKIYYAPKSNIAGQQWKTQLRDALNDCSELVVLLSEESVNSSWVMLEIGAAWARDIRVTPILIEKSLTMDMLPDFICDFQLVCYFSEEYDFYIDELHKRGKITE